MQLLSRAVKGIKEFCLVLKSDSYRDANYFAVIANPISRISFSLFTEQNCHLKDMSMVQQSLQSCTEIPFVSTMTKHNKVIIILIQEHLKHKVMKRNGTKQFWYCFPLCCDSRPTKVYIHKEQNTVGLSMSLK